MPAILAPFLLVCLILLGAGGWTAFWGLLMFLALFCPGLLLVLALFAPGILKKAARAAWDLVKHLFRPPDR